MRYSLIFFLQRVLSFRPYLNENIKRCFVLRNHYRSAKQVNLLCSRIIVAFDELSELTLCERTQFMLLDSSSLSSVGRVVEGLSEK